MCFFSCLLLDTDTVSHVCSLIRPSWRRGFRRGYLDVIWCYISCSFWSTFIEKYDTLWREFIVFNSDRYRVFVFVWIEGAAYFNPTFYTLASSLLACKTSTLMLLIVPEDYCTENRAKGTNSSRMRFINLLLIK